MNIAKHMELIFVAAAFVLCAASYTNNEQISTQASEATEATEATEITQTSRPAA